LFIGNTADPVTPLRNAVKMAAGHEGATVLIQDAPGHCSGTTIPSNCTWNVIKDFFNYGKLPKNGTLCEVDWKPWDKLEV
jgi:TAP-like protein